MYVEMYEFDKAILSPKVTSLVKKEWNRDAPDQFTYNRSKDRWKGGG